LTGIIDSSHVYGGIIMNDQMEERNEGALSGRAAKSSCFPKGVLSVLFLLSIFILPEQVLPGEDLGAAEKLFNAQEYKKAVKYLKKVTEKDPSNTRAWVLMGDSYRSWGKNGQAVMCYEKAIGLDASQKEALMGMGMSYGNMNKHGQAVAPLKYLVKIDPSNALAHFYLGVSYEAIRSMGLAWEEYKILKALDEELANKLYHIIFW
jgi:Tfp pilus assembly protein PilF